MGLGELGHDSSALIGPERARDPIKYAEKSGKDFPSR